MKIKQFKSVILYLLWIGLFQRVFAQQPAGRFIAENESIPSREVYSILEDKKGFIWIGCEAGLYKYNGVKFEHHAPSLLQSKEISGLNLDAKGDIFAYNFSGQMLKTDGKNTQLLPPLSPKPMSGFPNLFADHKGAIWATQNNIFSTFNRAKNNWEQINNPQIRETNVYRLLPYQNKTYFTNQNAVFQFEGENLIQYPIEWQKGNDTNIVSYILAVLNGQIALVHTFGKAVFVLENGKFSHIKNPALLKAIQSRKINAIQQLKNGEWWLMTYTGIITFDFQTNQAKEYYKGIAFSNILEDQRGQLWLTTLKQGILLIPNQALLWFSKEFFGFQESRINHIAYSEAEERVYFSFLNGNIGSLSIENFDFKSFSTGFQGDINLFEVHQNQLYYNLRDTLFIKKGQNEQMLVYGLPTPKTMLPLKNQILIGSSIGLYVLKPFNLAHNISLAYEKLYEFWVKDIFWDEKRALLWVSTNKGIMVYELQNEKFVFKKHLFVNQYFRKIGIMEQLGLVAVTIAGEIYDLLNQKKLYQPSNNPSLLVYSAKITDNQIILVSNQGIYLYHSNQQMQQIGNWDGLTNGEVYQTCLANQHIWAATSGGIFVLPLLATKQKSWIAPKVYIKSIQVDNLAITLSNKIFLRYDQKLCLELEASAMASGRDYRFLYRVGKGKWEFLNPENPLIILNILPKGNFSIQIKVEDHRKIPSDNTIRLQVFVQAPFWEMWWFYVLLVVLGGFLAGLVLQNRFKKLQKQQQVKAERLRLEQDLRIARLTALKAQMKPHFIFNVLNSIQSFIYQNKPQDAKAYLGKFSKFMRLALTHSDKEWVNLGEELSMIQNYVDLEAMQLEGGFEYHLSIDDSLKISQLLIPSFLLQPIIENVFKHAFKNKKTLKKLHLKVQDISIDFFKIIVEDNGIGRAKAIQNKQKTPDKHQSFATVAMAEKLTLLNTQSPESIVFSVVDLEDEKENALGTQVNVQLKKNKNDI